MGLTSEQRSAAMRKAARTRAERDRVFYAAEHERRENCSTCKGLGYVELPRDPHDPAEHCCELMEALCDSGLVGGRLVDCPEEHFEKRPPVVKRKIS